MTAKKREHLLQGHCHQNVCRISKLFEPHPRFIHHISFAPYRSNTSLCLLTTMAPSTECQDEGNDIGISSCPAKIFLSVPHAEKQESCNSGRRKQRLLCHR